MPKAIVIFGATGDLARRKLIPALYHLLQRKEMSDDIPVVCLGRRAMEDEAFLRHLEFERYIGDARPEYLDKMVSSIRYSRFDLANAHVGELRNILQKELSSDPGETDLMFYLALPTRMFDKAVRLIRPLLSGTGRCRVVFEKPFGEDLSSAERLNEVITGVLDEEQVFRVDHYLGKELVQNILFLRFSNEIFSCAWNRDAIDCVQITVSEDLGVGDRAGYYDRSGAIRDMLQNHLLQLLAFTAMEPPLTGQGNAVRDESARVIETLRRPEPGDVVVGQYGAGQCGGEDCVPYRKEAGIPPESVTETYVALRAYVDTARWRDVPFYLRTGKRLSERYAEIKIVFKQHDLNGLAPQDKANQIIIRIQPDEGIALAFNVRKPGSGGQTESVFMDFCHSCHFGPNTPEAYEAILASVLKGDPLLFTRWDWLQASWKYIDQVRAAAQGLSLYPAGSSGPREADALLEADGRTWL